MDQDREQASCIQRIGDEPEPSYEDCWIKVYHEAVRFPSGQSGEYNRIVEGTTGKGVACVPVSPDGQIGLIRVFRYPLGKELWEIVRGYADSEDLPGEARRELQEELGYSSPQIAECQQLRLGVIYPNSGVLATELTVFAFVGVPRLNGALNTDKGSVREGRFLSPNEVRRWVRTGQLSDAITLSALGMLSIAGLANLWQEQR